MRLTLLAGLCCLVLVGCASSDTVRGGSSDLRLAPDEDGNIAEVDQMPQALQPLVPVRYPASARRAGTEGTVRLSFVVQENGEVADVRVHRSVSPELDQVAVQSVQQQYFSPALVNGEPVAVRVIAPLRFRIADGRR